jgi:hypothetical protein
MIREEFQERETTSLILPIFKGRHKNDPGNYRIIVIRLVFTKVFGGIVKREVSKWVEEEGKRDKGQANFRPKHSTIDQCLMLRHMIEKTWESEDKELWGYFVDFKKAFDTISREKLLERLVEIGIPSKWKAAIYMLRKQVKDKIKTKECLSESFNTHIGTEIRMSSFPHTMQGLHRQARKMDK